MANIYTATWNDFGNGSGVYECFDLTDQPSGVFSDDGDNWTDQAGEPVSGGDFANASFRFAAGPRNGVTVS